MNVRFYQLSKRNRSTKLPSGTYKEVDCQLKEMTNITNPTLLLQSFAPVFYNYVYIQEWRRFYFISNITSIEGMWEVTCTEDCLATFRAYILETTANVLYATGSTKSIVDSRIPVKSSVLIGHEQESISGLTVTDGNLGTIILGITGKGSFGTYVLQNAADLPDLLDGVDSWWTTEATSQLDAAKQLFYGGSAGECIKGAIGIPIVFAGTDVGVLENLYLGNYPCKRSNDTNIKGYRITNPILKGNGTINIPWQSSDWKKVSAYTSITCYFPLIGLISIPATEVQNETTLSYVYSVNITSGDVALEVRATSSKKKLAVGSSNCAMAAPIGSTGIDTSKVNTAVVSGVGAAVAGISAITGGLTLPLAAAIGGGLASMAGNTLSALGGNSEGSGGLSGGSMQGLDKVVHCFVIQKELTDTQTNFNKIIGKPFMGVSKIGNFIGYIQTDGFQLASDFAYDVEKDKVNQLLDTGIYIE